MANRKRTKESCFRCRALHVGSAGADCMLGEPLSVSDAGFYCPGIGVRCFKPLTREALIEAQSITKLAKENNKQMSLLEIG